jgi:hypothetical protein
MEEEALKNDAMLSVLVLVAEEAEDLLDLHQEAVTELEKVGAPFEVLYLVAPASARTLSLARQLQQEEGERVHVIQFAQAMGQAAMLAAGIERAKGQILVTLPARFEADLGVLGALHREIREGADLVVAARARAGLLARVRSDLFNKLVSLAAGSAHRDIASETRAFRREVADETPLYGDFHRYLPLLAERLGFSVREIPAAPHPRMTARFGGSLSVYFWRAIDILSIFFISRFTRYPLRLFGGVGSVFAAFGFAILLVVGVQRLLGDPLANRPVLVLGTLLVGLGVQAFTIGLLGELLLFFHARDIRDYRIAVIYEGDSSQKLASPDESVSSDDSPAGSSHTPPAPFRESSHGTSGSPLALAMVKEEAGRNGTES